MLRGVARQRPPRPRHLAAVSVAAWWCLVLQPAAVAEDAPASLILNEEEKARALQCGEDGKYLDFTSLTIGGALPQCVPSCPLGSEALGEAARPYGDVPSCVWAKSPNKVRLRFELHETCQESQCFARGRWDLYRQIVSVKMAHILGVPLSEVRSAFLYWMVPVWPPPSSSPSLQKFLVSRAGEADFPGAGARRRLEGGVDPWVMMRMAFRVDSARIKKDSRGVDLLQKSNDTGNLQKYGGVSATVHRIEIDDATPDSAGSVEDFLPVYQFWGFDVNQIPGEGYQFGGVLRPSQLKSCHDVCYVFDEVPKNSQCVNDCECNGNRWCNHFGQCTGVFAPCRIEGGVVTTRPTTVLTTATKTTTQSVGGTTTTTTPHALQLLTSKTCYTLASELWRPCYIGTEVSSCGSIACAVLDTIVGNPDCANDLCTAIGQGTTDPVDFWLEQCSNETLKASSSKARAERCSTPEPTMAPTAAPVVADDDGSAILILAAALSVVFCCCCTCCVAVGLLRRYQRQRFYAFLNRCCGVSLTSKGSSKRFPQGNKRQGPPLRASSTMKPMPQTQSWMDRAKQHFGAKVVNVSDDESDSVYEETTSPKTVPGSRPTSSSQNSDASAGAREAWTEGTGAAFGGSHPSRTAGPRVAASQVGLPPKVVVETPGDVLLLELRRLRGSEHSAADRKKFFKEQLLKWHPDKNIGKEEHAAEMFKVLQDNKGWFLMED